MNPRQQPVASPFGASSTAAEVLRGVDLSGRVAIVTGASSGIGIETVRSLAAAGATVVAPVRNLEKGRAALAGIPRVQLERLDLLDPASIDAFAARFSGPLHLLITNAGGVVPTLERDARGLEAQFASNHLGHFQLVKRLWAALAPGARVVSLSSLGHRRSAFDFEDWNFERRAYDPMVAYGQSKTANALFAVALAARGVRAFSVHPGGIINTGFVRFMSAAAVQASGYVNPDGSPKIDPDANMKTPEMGAATSVWCATSPLLEERGGEYCVDCNVAPLVDGDSNDHRGVRAWAVDSRDAERLWALSERLLART